MTKPGLAALLLALTLTLVTLTGAWSYSLAEVVSRGALLVVPSGAALLGVEDLAIPGAQRTRTTTRDLAVHNRSAHGLSVSFLADSPKDLGLSVHPESQWASPGATVTFLVSVTPDDKAALAVHFVPFTVTGHGAGFGAQVGGMMEAEVVNCPPVAVDDQVTSKRGRPVTFHPLTHGPVRDYDPDKGKLEVIAITPPDHGSAVLHHNDRITYTPPPNWSGTATFHYTITDGQGGTDTGTVRVTVSDS